MALAGNKNDMYENEEVEESEGKKFINPNLSVGGETPKVDNQDKGQKLKKVDEKGKGKKKKCC